MSKLVNALNPILPSDFSPFVFLIVPEHGVPKVIRCKDDEQAFQVRLHFNEQKLKDPGFARLYQIKEL